MIMKRQSYFCSIYCLLFIEVIISILVKFIFALVSEDDQECTVSPPRWIVVSIEVHKLNEMEIHTLQGILFKCVLNRLIHPSGLGF